MHRILTGLFVGAGVVSEIDGQPGIAADGDDDNGSADEGNGVNFPLGGFDFWSPSLAELLVTNQLSVPARACGFFDWNAEADLADTSENSRVAAPGGSSNLSLMLNFSIVPVSSVGGTHARFRLSTDTACVSRAERRCPHCSGPHGPHRGPFSFDSGHSLKCTEKKAVTLAYS